MRTVLVATAVARWGLFRPTLPAATQPQHALGHENMLKKPVKNESPSRRIAGRLPSWRVTGTPARRSSHRPGRRPRCHGRTVARLRVPDGH